MAESSSNSHLSPIDTGISDGETPTTTSFDGLLGLSTGTPSGLSDTGILSTSGGVESASSLSAESPVSPSNPTDAGVSTGAGTISASNTARTPTGDSAGQLSSSEDGSGEPTSTGNQATEDGQPTGTTSQATDDGEATNSLSSYTAVSSQTSSMGVPLESSSNGSAVVGWYRQCCLGYTRQRHILCPIRIDFPDNYHLSVHINPWHFNQYYDFCNHEPSLYRRYRNNKQLRRALRVHLSIGILPTGAMHLFNVWTPGSPAAGDRRAGKPEARHGRKLSRIMRLCVQSW